MIMYLLAALINTTSQNWKSFCEKHLIADDPYDTREHQQKEWDETYGKDLDKKNVDNDKDNES